MYMCNVHVTLKHYDYRHIEMKILSRKILQLQQIIMSNSAIRVFIMYHSLKNPQVAWTFNSLIITVIRIQFVYSVVGRSYGHISL